MQPDVELAQAGLPRDDGVEHAGGQRQALQLRLQGEQRLVGLHGPLVGGLQPLEFGLCLLVLLFEGQALLPLLPARLTATQGLKRLARVV